MSEKMLETTDKHALHERELGHVTFMALEAGAQWPGGLKPLGENAPDRMVIAQQLGEPSAEFAARVKHRLEQLREHGRAIRIAVLATARSFDFVVLETRCALAHALLRAVSETPGAELVLTSTDDPAPENRAHLFALAGALGESVAYKIGIRVRFGTAEDPAAARGTKSGIYRKRTPLYERNSEAG